MKAHETKHVVGATDRKANRRTSPKMKMVQAEHVRTPGSSPHARFRSGIPTGTTPHFRMWMADLRLKSALQKTKLISLASATATEPKAAAGYAMIATSRGLRIKSVWDLVNRKRSELLDIPGIGPARLRALHADLVKHNVQPKWSAE